MPELHWDVVRLILLQLYVDSYLPPPSPARGASRSALLVCSRVSQKFNVEIQELVYKDVDLTHFYKHRAPLNWAFASPHRERLCANVQALRLPCVSLQEKITSLIRACPNLKILELQVGNVEKKDCLTECLQGALSKSPSIREVRLLHASSIRTLEIVYNLPYRLDKLHIIGLHGYRMNLWENSEEYIDAAQLVLEKCKVMGWDVHYLFERLQHPKVKKPPRTLTLINSMLELERIPEPAATAITEMIIDEAQQLLKLDRLERFQSLEQLSFGIKHDFASLSTPLSHIKSFTILLLNENLLKLICPWLDKGLLPQLETVIFAHGSCSEGIKTQYGLTLLKKLEDLLLDLNIICKPAFPSF